MPQTCSTFAAYICGAFATNAFFVCKLLFWRTVLAHNVRRKFAAHSCRTLYWHTMCVASYAAHSCRALFWRTMCAVQVSLQRTVASHCTGTQCAPQVCSAQLSRTILAHNVRRTGKFAAHSCRTLFLCATTLRRTVAVHCTVLPTPPTPTPGLSSPPPYIFLVPYPQGECKKKCGDGRSVTKNKNLGVGVGKNVGAGGW